MAHGLTNGERLAGRIFPRTKLSASEITNVAIARREFDLAAPGVRYHLFSLPPNLESLIAVLFVAAVSANEFSVPSIDDFVGVSASLDARHIQGGVNRAGSLKQLLAGSLTRPIASQFVAWCPGQPIPIPYFTPDAE